MVNPRDIAGNAEEEEKKDNIHPYATQLDQKARIAQI